VIDATIASTDRGIWAIKWSRHPRDHGRRFAEPQPEGARHHTPDPFLVSGKLASGLLEIVDTPQGEACVCACRATRKACRRMSPSNDPTGWSNVCRCRRSAATTTICRALSPRPSRMEFSARLQLAAGADSEDLAFAMAEPEGHHGHEHVHG